MKLTEELKKKIEEAGNREEAEKIMKEAGIELTDEELSQFDGGFITDYLSPWVCSKDPKHYECRGTQVIRMKYKCPRCGAALTSFRE